MTVRVRVRHADKSWLPMVAVLVPLTGSEPEPGFAFVLRADHEAESNAPEGSGSSSDRIAALEHRLWRIALELKAAGIVQQVRHLPDFKHIPEVNDLTTRQLEVLTRLLEGQRVPTIAAETYVSTSTVRNHLAAIYRKLGVHSQAELLAKVRRPGDDVRTHPTFRRRHSLAKSPRWSGGSGGAKRYPCAQSHRSPRSSRPGRRTRRPRQ